MPTMDFLPINKCLRKLFRDHGFLGKQYNSEILADYKDMPLNLFTFKRALCTALSLTCLVSSSWAKETLPNVELTGGLLFQIIASEFALQRNDPATAFQTYMQTARTTKDPRLAKRAFEIADGAHAFEQASEAAQLWEKLSPSNADAQLANTLTQIRQGDLSEKRQQSAKDLILSAKNQQERLKRFQAIALQAQFSSAQPQQILTFLRPLASLCKDQKEAALTLAKLYRRTGNAELGEHFAKIAWQQLPDSTVALLEYADTLIAKEPLKAVSTLENFVKRHPKDYDAQLGLAKAYARTQNKNGVKKQIKILDPFSQKMPNLAFTLASICDTVGLLEETKRYLMTFERLAKAQKVSLERLPRTYLSLGMIDYKQRHFSAAADWFSQVDQSSEFFPQSRLFLAQALAAEKHFDEAIEVLDKTKVNDRLKTEFLHKRAQILYEADRLPQAYEAMKKALSTDKDNATLLFQCAVIANEIKRIDEAEKYLQNAIELYPDNANFYNTLGYLWVENGVKLDQAKLLIEKALRQEPENPAFLDSMGWLYFKQGSLKQAQNYLEKAAKLSNDKEILLHLAEVYQAQGETPKAMDILRPMLKENVEDQEINSLMDRLHLRF